MIRKAEIKDLDRILVLLKEVNNVHAKLRPDLFIEGKTKYTQQELEEIILNNTKIIFVYVDKDDVVLAYLICEEQITEQHNNRKYVKTLYFDDVCIDPLHRRIGIGTKLYLHAVKYARDNGYYRITLNVWASNEESEHMIGSLDLSEEKTTYEQIL